MTYLEVKINRSIPATLVTILNEGHGNGTVEVDVCDGTLAVKIDVPDDRVGDVVEFIEEVETVIKWVLTPDGLVVDTTVYFHRGTVVF